VAPRGAFPDPGQLDGDRRRALQELIAALTAVVAEAQVVTTAALHFDLGSLGAAIARLADKGADPAFDLGGVNEVYRALRQAIVERQPGRVVGGVREAEPHAAAVPVLVTRYRHSGTGPTGLRPEQGQPDRD